MPARPSAAKLLPAAGVAVLALAVLALLAPAAAAEKGERFPLADRTFYLTSAAAPGGGLLLAESPGAQGQQTFVGPGVTALGVVDQRASQAWTSELAWPKDLEVVGDATAVLYFQANAHGLADLAVRLYDVAPDGVADLAAAESRQFLTVLDGAPVEIVLDTSGLRLPQGHVLRLEVAVGTGNLAAVLQHGGPTPSALRHVATRWLDTDGDGMAESDEQAVGRNPGDANDPAGTLDEGRDGDADGLSDRAEASFGTDATDPDSDGDGARDGVEVHAGTDPLDPASVPADADGDGLPDGFEAAYFGDDSAEPAADPDGDGCDNRCEAANGTSPVAFDSDGDGASDGEEVGDRTDPLSAASVASLARGTEPPLAAAFFALGSTLCLVPLVRRP